MKHIKLRTILALSTVCDAGYEGETCEDYVAGMIHYTDGTRSWEYDSSKTPNGVCIGNTMYIALEDAPGATGVRSTYLFNKNIVPDINAGLSAAGGTPLSGFYALSNGGTNCNKNDINSHWALSVSTGKVICLESGSDYKYREMDWH